MKSVDDDNTEITESLDRVGASVAPRHLRKEVGTAPSSGVMCRTVTCLEIAEGERGDCERTPLGQELPVAGVRFRFAGTHKPLMSRRSGGRWRRRPCFWHGIGSDVRVEFKMGSIMK